ARERESVLQPARTSAGATPLTYPTAMAAPTPSPSVRQVAIKVTANAARGNTASIQATLAAGTPRTRARRSDASCPTGPTRAAARTRIDAGGPPGRTLPPAVPHKTGPKTRHTIHRA